MAQGSAIEWTESTWNPVVGCTKISAGCDHCYAERMAKRLAAMARAAKSRNANPGRTANYLKVVNSCGQWSGRIHLDWEALQDPLHWPAPRTIFVNSMSDLFHEAIPFEFVRQAFDVMNRCPQHTFQVLTKRPDVAAKYAPQLKWTPNIWLGTTVEDERVLGRIAHLCQIKAHVRFLSLEPLLGPLDNLPLRGIDWVIAGGESGPGARAMKPEWVTAIRDQCLAQHVAFFFKQWGGVNKKRAGRRLAGRTWDQMPSMTRSIMRREPNNVQLAGTTR
jgi:protein gp37